MQYLPTWHVWVFITINCIMECDKILKEYKVVHKNIALIEHNGYTSVQILSKLGEPELGLVL